MSLTISLIDLSIYQTIFSLTISLSHTHTQYTHTLSLSLSLSLSTHGDTCVATAPAAAWNESGRLQLYVNGVFKGSTPLEYPASLAASNTTSSSSSTNGSSTNIAGSFGRLLERVGSASGVAPTVLASADGTGHVPVHAFVGHVAKYSYSASAVGEAKDFV